MPGLHPGDASATLADSTAPVVQEEGHRKTLRPAPRRAGRGDLLRVRTRGRGSRGGGARWGELRVADAPGTVSQGRCREASFPNELFTPRRCGCTTACGRSGFAGPWLSLYSVHFVDSVQFESSPAWGTTFAAFVHARADSLTRIAVCNTAREGLIPSRLSTPHSPNGRAIAF